MQQKMSKAIFLFFLTLTGQQAFAELPRITNVRFEMNDSVVVIMYDVAAGKTKVQSADEIDVVAILRKENDPGFSYPLAFVSGDVGKHRKSGKNKKIFWDIQKEFPNGIEGTDYYFEVRMEPAVEEADDTYTWIGIGTGIAVVGGLATYFIVTGNSGEGKNGGFPLPPGRPK